MNVTFEEYEAYAQEGPIEVIEGASLTFTCTFWGDVTNPSATVYRINPTGAEDVTSTVMPSGSHTASGTVATLKSLTALEGPALYNVYVTGSVNADSHIKKIQVEVLSLLDTD